MMVNLARNLRHLIRNHDAAIWDRSAVYEREIRGLKVGLWVMAASVVGPPAPSARWA